MPVAAVPSYLGTDFSNASPGMRFGVYLPIWTNRKDQQEVIKDRAKRKSKKGKELSEHLKRHGMNATLEEWIARDCLPKLWTKNDDARRQCWREVTRLGEHDTKLMRSLFARQQALGSLEGDVNRVVRFDAQAVAPFTAGLGNEHPLENGFAFLNPYGLPYLPGSGVKGVLRQAARELASGDWGDTFGWSEEQCFSVRVAKKTVPLTMLDVLFGLESAEGETGDVRGALSFWDVVPQIDGKSLMVEIMTPHQSHYYQWRKDENGHEIQESPHESGQPNPIVFLTVPPGSRFTFYVACDLERLNKMAPALAEDGRWKDLLDPVFKHAFAWCGFGAKTAVGYGSMRPVEPRATELAARNELEAEYRALSREERAIKELRASYERDQAAGRREPQGELASRRVDLLRQAKSWESAELRSKAADLIEETVRWMDWPKRKREDRNRQVRELREDLKSGD